AGGVRFRLGEAYVREGRLDEARVHLGQAMRDAGALMPALGWWLLSWPVALTPRAARARAARRAGAGGRGGAPSAPAAGGRRRAGGRGGGRTRNARARARARARLARPRDRDPRRPDAVSAVHARVAPRALAVRPDPSPQRPLAARPRRRSPRRAHDPLLHG